MSTDKGFIKLYRDINDHWVWDNKDEPFDRAHAWIDLIMMMNYEDNKFFFMGELTTVKRGSRITSLRRLSERWGWSKDKVSRFLDVLESEGMIRQHRDSKKTLITVVNYDFYQGCDSNKKTAKRQRKDAEKTQTGRASDADRNKQEIIKERERKKKEEPSQDELEKEGWGFD